MCNKKKRLGPVLAIHVEALRWFVSRFCSSNQSVLFVFVTVALLNCCERLISGLGRALDS